MRIAYVGNFEPRHSTETHIAATLEYLGHEVMRLQENDPATTSWLDSRVARGETDLFLFTRTWGDTVTLQHLARLKDLGIPTVSYHLDLYVGLQREDGLDNDPFWRTQYVFTPDGDPHSAEVFKRKAINHYYMKPGVYKAECGYGHPRPNLMHDVAFVGGGIEYMHPEWPYRRELVQWLMENYDAMTANTPPVPRFGKYGHPQRVMRNQDLNDLYSSAKVVVGDSVCIGFNHERYWSDRLYETLGRGGFLIHPYIVGLEDEFTLDGPDQNLVTYEYGNFEQLHGLIDYYVAHDDERELIRRAGHEFVKEHATYHNRLQQMLEVVMPYGSLYSQSLEELHQSELNEVSDRFDSQRINLGAGNDPTPGFVNVDMLDLPGIDVVHNLMDFPYPFEDESAAEIRAIDVLEHLDHYTADRRPSVIAFIEECHRILKPGGELYIQTPGYDAEFMWQDVTHVRGFHPKSMDLFDPDTEYGKTNGYYSKATFKVRVEQLPNKNLRYWMTKG